MTRRALKAEKPANRPPRPADRVPDGPFPSNVIADVLLMTPGRVTQLRDAGRFPVIGQGRYPLVPCIHAYIQFLREMKPVGGEERGEEILAYKDRLYRARAEGLEMENAKMRGELLPARAVERAWTAMTSAMKTKVLSVPVKAAPQIVSLNNIAQVKTLLERMLVEALDELSRTDYLGDSVVVSESAALGAEDGRAATDPDGERVGGSVSETLTGE